MRDNTKIWQVQVEQCCHIWNEEVQRFDSGKIEIHGKCEKCGTKIIEKYRFVEGIELDNNGNVTGVYQ